MRQFNIVSRTLLILTVITSTRAAPVLVQEKRQACVDVVQVPEDAITVLEKRILDEDLDVLWDGWWHYANVLEAAPLPQLNQDLVHIHVPPHSPADTVLAIVGSDSDSDSDTVYSHTIPADSDSGRESMELDDDAPPGNSESGYSRSPPTSPEWWSTQSEDRYTASSSLGLSDADADSDRWSTISNAPSAESQSNNLKSADTTMRGKAKVERRISSTASGVDMVELRSAVASDHGP